MSNALCLGANAVFGQRLAKELRLLWLPFTGAAGAACVFCAMVWLERGPDRMFLPMLGVPTALAFFGCVLLMAVAPVGSEFQHRTLGLLLSQPSNRGRLWRDKLAAPALGLLVLAMFVGVAALSVEAQQARPSLGIAFTQEAEVRTMFSWAVLFAVTGLCTAPFWTLSARSIIGGMAFTWIGQFFVLLIMNYIAEKTGLQEGLALGIGAISYSATFLWLGWRKFASMEVREGYALAGPAAEGLGEKPQGWGWLQRLKRLWASGTQALWLDRLLRCSPASSAGNLFRKELRLQKPVYLLAALFFAAWVLVFGLCLLQPTKGYHNLFPAMLALYTPLVMMLAGSLSISEETSLGVAGWHLSLPVSARRQWWFKLGASTAAGAAAAWILPAVLWVLSGILVKPMAIPEQLVQPVLVLAAISSLLFVLSFWAVALLGNTVRAILMAIVAVLVLFYCLAAGVSAAEHFSGLPAGIGTRFILTCVSPDSPLHGYVADAQAYALPMCIGILVLVALGQSLRAFRRPGLRSKVVLYPALLVLAAVLLGYFQRCL
jgi:hypothetical protein